MRTDLYITVNIPNPLVVFPRDRSKIAPSYVQVQKRVT